MCLEVRTMPGQLSIPYTGTVVPPNQLAWRIACLSRVGPVTVGSSSC